MVVKIKSLLNKGEKTKLLETFRSSGQTQAAFAEVNGINPKTLASQQAHDAHSLLLP